MTVSARADGLQSAGPPAWSRIVLVLAPFGAGYFFSYLFRALNAVVAPDLVRDVGLDATSLGILTSAYLFAFGLFQIPLGLLLDRFGPRRVQAALVATAALGSLLFGLAESALVLTVARAMIGLGFAGGLMASFKAVVIWVPPQRMALANGVVMSAGAIGVIVATAPIDAAVQFFGWREVFFGLAALTLAVSVWLLHGVPERGGAGAGDGLGRQIRAIGTIYRDGLFWRICPIVITTGGAHIAIQTLWAGRWFDSVAGLPRDQVAENLLYMAFAFFVGVLFSGIIADLLGRIGISLLQTMAGLLIGFIGCQVPILFLPGQYEMPAWLLFGMLGQTSVLAYAALSQHFGAALSGRANTAMNLLLFLSAFAIQALIGAILDFVQRSLGIASPAFAYFIAFGLAWALQVLALIWYLLSPHRMRQVMA